ncbi:carboxylesterase family protein [Oxalobacteraceae bacterium OM1]|nr:carboxylesterase family protein [Oxalobacteraceae bacterium OM1]
MIGKTMWRQRLGLAGLAIAAAGLAGCGDGRDDNLVATDKGYVRGSETEVMRQYLGIPYAAPPVGELRWKAPQPAAAWTAARDATSYAKHCAQPASPFGTASTSEDCLYLNVYAPKGNGPFPVMVWIHGGALLTGESDDYDPTALVKQGVAVVTLNYRLGPLGFLTHPALTTEGGGSSGNYGLMDQQAALRWVKANIANFAGDPSNVTIFGESAGGLSTHSQIASPLAAGLFQKAIVESGAYNLAAPALATAEKLGQAFATGAGCTDQSLTCLRSLPVDRIIANSTAVQVGGTTLPTVDGKVLPLTFNDAFSSGRFNKVPVIEGSNQHEYSLLSAVTIDPVLGRPINASEYPARINALVGATLGAAVLNAYPLNTTETPAQTYDNVLTDTAFSCNGRKVARLMAANGSTVYTYEFADANAPMVFRIPPRPEGYGAYHAAEIQYVFPKQQTVYFGAPFTAAQTDLSNRMVSYWTQFAKTGNPNGAGNATWPAYTAANDTYLTLAPGAVAPTTQFAAAHKCGFWTPGV